MPHEIVLENLPAGYSLNAARDGEMLSVQYFEFVSTEDGQRFIERLEGFPDELLGAIASQRSIRPSEVDHILAIVRANKSATVYVNEIPQIVSIRVGRPVNKGDQVFKDDIVDFGDFNLGEIDIPNDCGVVFLFSVGWRKGLFYDFGPLSPDVGPRTYDCSKLFGQLHAHLFFQERFSISEEIWKALLSSKWFPFSALKNSTIERLIGHASVGWDLDELINDIAKEVKSKCPELIRLWERHPSFVPHIDILRKAVEHFENQDYISCTGLLYPRIEGILRTNLRHTIGGNVTQASLSSAAVQSRISNPKCLLLPHKFEEYLRQVYFASFDPNDLNIAVSRNSVSHGTAAHENFNAKAALIGILTAHHLYFCFERSP